MADTWFDRFWIELMLLDLPDAQQEKFCCLCGGKGHTAPYCPWQQLRKKA